MTGLVVHEPGPFSTVQDLGRYGWQRFGVVVAGAMDGFAFRAANALVGNAPEQAAIEFTLMGGQYEIDSGEATVAVAGGRFAVRVDGKPMAPWRSFRLRAGQRLAIGGADDAARGYLAIGGGIAVEPVLGSRSTHVRSGIGGWQGRALAAGDRLPVGPGEGARHDRLLPAAALPPPRPRIRVVLGPQDDHFDRQAIETFLGSTYAVTPEADRMGYRLDGPPIGHAGRDNIVSDGIALGSVQIPGNGRPIVLLADRQPTGGYPKIATVIGPDIRAIAQSRPGDRLRFEPTSLSDARRLRLDWERRLAAIGDDLRAADEGERFDSRRLLALNLVSGVVADGES